MNPRILLPLISAIVYVAIWFGLALGQVDVTPKPSAGPYGWMLPIAILLLMVPQAICAFVAGRFSITKDGDGNG